MTHPTVSVVMPVHNTARFVEAAISSVLTQTFSDFELLIIDDQGTDDAIDLCRQFVDPRIRIISQENRGLAGARNTGIRQAKGRYIALLDSDDLWLPEKLERHVAHLDANSDVGVSYAASRLIADDGTPLSVAQRPKLTNITSDNIFLRNPVGNGSAAVIRRKALGEIAHTSHRQGEMNYFDESFRQSEDIECWTRIRRTCERCHQALPSDGKMPLRPTNSGTSPDAQSAWVTRAWQSISLCALSPNVRKFFWPSRSKRQQLWLPPYCFVTFQPAPIWRCKRV